MRQWRRGISGNCDGDCGEPAQFAASRHSATNQSTARDSATGKPLNRLGDAVLDGAD